jgi:hypothetical protein
MSKQRYVARCNLVTAGKRSKPRRAEPSMNCLLGWDRGAGAAAPRAPAAAAPYATAAPPAGNSQIQSTSSIKKNNKTFLSEAQAQFVYYSKASSVRKAFPAPSAPPRAEDIVPTDAVKRRYSLAACAAAAKAAGGEGGEGDLEARMLAAGNAAAQDIGSKNKIKVSAATERALKRKKKKSRKKRAPKLEGPKANFFNYGMNNTRGAHNYLQTHNVMPEDPREIYPNALHAAVRHPNADTAARAIAKAKFLKSHQDSVSAAADDLLAALSHDAEEAAAAALAARKSRLNKGGKGASKHGGSKSKGDSKDGEIEDVSPHVRRTMISNPPHDPNVTMWDLLRWRDPAAEAKAQAASDAVKAANAALAAVAAAAAAARKVVEKKAAPKRSRKKKKMNGSGGGGGGKPTRKSGGKGSSSKHTAGLPRVDSEVLAQFEKFEPQKIEMVDPKAFSSLPATWTKNIPPAGKKNPPRPPSQLDDM